MAISLETIEIWNSKENLESSADELVREIVRGACVRVDGLDVLRARVLAYRAMVLWNVRLLLCGACNEGGSDASIKGKHSRACIEIGRAMLRD